MKDFRMSAKQQNESQREREKGKEAGTKLSWHVACHQNDPWTKTTGRGEPFPFASSTRDSAAKKNARKTPHARAQRCRRPEAFRIYWCNLYEPQI